MIMRKICCSSVLTVFLLGLSMISKAAELQPCTETTKYHQTGWMQLSIHNQPQSRDCHSQLSDALKEKATTNEMLSHAVYHQILAGESFQTIPFWPDKHEDWMGFYDGYDYSAVFRPAINAAEKSWGEGFNGGVKHDFVVGWTLTVTDGDFRNNDYRNRTGQILNVKSYIVWPGIILFLLVSIEAIFNKFGWFPRVRLYHRNKNERLFSLKKHR